MPGCDADRGDYDLIFCDPPTFSNSARADDFDVQREHVRLLRAALARLAPRRLAVLLEQLPPLPLDEAALSRHRRSIEDSRPRRFRRISRATPASTVAGGCGAWAWTRGDEHREARRLVGVVQSNGCAIRCRPRRSMPSSRDLAQAMVDELPPDTHRVIELGGGTGSVTRALLAHGIARRRPAGHRTQRVIARTPAQRFPRCGSRLAMRSNCPKSPHTVVFSQVARPMRSCRASVCSRCRKTCRAASWPRFRCLRPGGRFIQFTYGPQAPVSERCSEALRLKVRRGGFVLRNVPPATVYVYERR